MDVDFDSLVCGTEECIKSSCCVGLCIFLQTLLKDAMIHTEHTVSDIFFHIMILFHTVWTVCKIVVYCS